MASARAATARRSKQAAEQHTARIQNGPKKATKKEKEEELLAQWKIRRDKKWKREKLDEGRRQRAEAAREREEREQGVGGGERSNVDVVQHCTLSSWVRINHHVKIPQTQPSSRPRRPVLLAPV